MKIILQVCFLVLFAVLAEAQHRVERAVGKNCPRNIDFPKGLTCKKCLKFRRRGTKAVFKCPKGYGRYGNRVLVCRQDDTWNGDPPVCVKSGCSPIDTTNDVNLVMSLHPKFNDAVITFQCEADYILFGANEIHCDGVQWSHAPPRCEAISDLIECDFEQDLCGWTQNHTVFGNQNWTRHIGSTQTGGTGPKRDHTYPNSDTGHYMYFESSTPVLEGDRAVLVSPPYTADLSPMCFEFWYHMLGPEEAGHVGSLEVYVKGESDDFNGLQPEFAIEGNQNNVWHRGEIYIDSMVESYQIIIKATKKKSYISDIAIDDVRLFNCTQTTTTTTTTTTIPSKTTALATTSSSTNITNRPVSSETSASVVVSTTSGNTTQTPVTVNFTQSVSKVITNTVTNTPSVFTTNGSVAVSTRASKTAAVTTAPVGTSESVMSTVTSAPKNITETVTVVSTLQNVTEKPAEVTTRQPTSNPITVKTVPTKVMTVTGSSSKSTGISTQEPTTKQAITSKVSTVVTMMTKRPQTSSVKMTTAVPTTMKKTTKRTSTMASFKTFTTMKPTTTSKTFPAVVTTNLKPRPTTPTSTTTIILSSSTSTIASTTTRKSSSSSKPSDPFISYAMSSSITPSSTISTSESLKTVKTVSSTNATDVAATATQTKSVTATISLVTTAKGSKGDNTSTTVTHHPDDETLKPLMIGLGVGIIVGLIIIGVIGWVCMRRRKFYTSRYEDELKPITNAASTQSLNNVDYYQDDFDIEHVQ